MGILIVDDNEDIRLAVGAILNPAGYKDIFYAESAEDAFRCLGLDDPTSSAKEIDLILMDIMMPKVDGIEACMRIKKNSRFSDLPIIMVTGKTEAEDLQMGFSVGAVDYIMKPINKIELLARVSSVLKLKFETDRRKAREKELVELTRQLKTANLKLKRLSFLDGLTGVANQRYFKEFLHKEFRHAIRNKKPIALIMVDIDFFKKFNDEYGHQAGDTCLKKVASALNRALKRPSDLLARYGGEEFVAVLPETDSSGAYHVAEKMQSAVSALRIPHARSRANKWVSISAGVSVSFPAEHDAPEDLVSISDEALYKAKREGRNRIVAKDLRSENFLAGSLQSARLQPENQKISSDAAAIQPLPNPERFR